MSISGRSSRYLASSLFAAAVSFLMLPLATRVLDAADYGVFALVTAFTTGVGSLAVVGAGFVLANRFPTALPEERKQIVSGLLCVAVVTAAVGVFACAAVFIGLRGSWSVVAAVPATGLVMALGTAMLLPLWLVAAELLTVEGRAGAFARASAAQTVASAGGTLLGLFVWDLQVDALFLGALCGAAAGTAAIIPVLRPYLTRTLRIEQVRRDTRGHGLFLVSQIIETGYGALERVLLSTVVGFRELGYYSHSQSYRMVVHLASKSVSRGAWPVTLSEARNPTAGFVSTRRVWSAVYVLVAWVGLAAAAVGDIVIELLTNDRLTGAWIYVPGWVVVVILQNLAKPQLGIVWTSADARTLARLGIVTSALSIVVLVSLVPLIGAPGALVAVMVGALAYRVRLSAIASRYGTTEFQDQWALAGIVAIAATTGLKLLLEPGTLGSAVLLVAVSLIWLAASRRVVGEAGRILGRGLRRPPV
jgi:O-antigen/teichoic acid export membrane protein